MTTTQILTAPGVLIPGPTRKKRVLLVDASAAKRDLRAETMRRLGVDVDCAADISEARSWWRADLYNLVLINGENALGNQEKFCEDLRRASPPQQLAFLVGKPEYLADMPMAMEESRDRSPESNEGENLKRNLPSPSPGIGPQRWGIMEASRRISEVRSAAHARAKAIRERPTPPRDSEMRLSKRQSEPRTLDDLLKEETQ
ncbi:MAG TPA: response regulator [Terriglobales bacterium]|nr:response regulator [Terriglobales bacterium]